MPRDRPFSRTALAGRLRCCAAVLCLLSAPSRAEGGPCEAWPGEPTPLPTAADPIAVRARYAQLRAADLAGRAAAIEAATPGEAHRLWLHADCLAPGLEATARGIERTRPVRVHRPEVRRSGGARAAAAPPPADPWASLSLPVAVTGTRYVDPEARAAARAVLLRNADARLVAGEELLRQARFREALVVCADVRGRLDRMRRARDLDDLRLRVEVLSATAELALGEEAAAMASLTRAIAVEPGLSFDTGRTSPKLLRALEAAKASAGGTP